MEAILKAQLLKEELDALRPISRENELRIMQKFRLDWNYHSNNLEGNSLTYGETKALILFGLTAQGKPFKDHLEMTGHNEAVEWVVELVKEGRPLTQAFIRELHTLLLKEPYQVDAITPAGEPTKKWITVGDYKKTPNHVLTKTGEIFRFASVEETPARMTDLVDWFQTEKEKENYNVITTAIEFHYRFIRIHPFDDGNGRTARILMNFILMQSGYPPVIIKTSDKQQYIAALEQADAGIFEPFINYIVENLCTSLELMIKGAKGESVEEEDDIDKEIEMLDLRLRSVGKKIDAIRTPEIIIDFSKSVVYQVLEEFATAVFSFKNLFQNITIHISSPAFGHRDYNFLEINMFVGNVLEYIMNYNRLDFIYVFMTLTELQYDKLENQKLQFPLRIDFEENFANFTVGDFKFLIPYYSNLDEMVLKEITRVIKKHGVNEINKIIQQVKSFRENTV